MRIEGQAGLRYALGMTPKRTYDREGHAHCVTSSGFRRRRLLDHDRPKKVVLGVRNSQLALQRGKCNGFVVMPDHVHAIVHFPDPIKSVDS
jgi:putative transposase